MKKRKRWIISFSIVVIISILGLFTPEGKDLYATIDPGIELADVAWMLTATILVLLMTPGVSFFYGGMVKVKNVISTMLQSFIAMGIISVLWVVVGFSLTFGDDIAGIIGNPGTFFMFKDVGVKASSLAPTIPLALFALFQMKFAILTPALITGSFAERVKFSSYIVFMLLFTLLVYAPLAHCTWHPHGLFKQMGVVDFAGGIVVHASSGVAALAGAIFLGKRNGKGTVHRPANIPFVLLGTALLWIGWFGFNAGSAMAANGIAIKAFLNTNTASAVAMLTWLFFDGLRGHKMSAMGAAVGAVAGLVGITPSAGYVTVGESIFIGFITAIVCNIAVYWKNKSSLDDALDVFPVHGVGGILGTILTGVFVDGLLDGKVDVFLNHVLAVGIVIIYTFVVAYALYWFTNKIVKMRVSPESELIGLDKSQHDERYGSDFEETEFN